MTTYKSVSLQEANALYSIGVIPERRHERQFLEWKLCTLHPHTQFMSVYGASWWRGAEFRVEVE